MYSNNPFSQKINAVGRFILIFIFLISSISINGVYVNNVSDLSGAFGTYTEYISFANYMGTLGICIGMSIIIRLKKRFKSKIIIITSTSSLAIISYIIANTNQIEILIIGSLLIGFFKILVMGEMVFPLMAALAPTGDKGKFYSLLYIVVLGLGQVTAYFFSSLVFNGTWQSPYLFMSGVMMILTLLTFLTTHNYRFSFKFPLYQIDYWSYLLLIIGYTALNLALTFMKQQYWFHSPIIRYSFVVAFCSIFGFLYLHKSKKRKTIDYLSIFKNPDIVHGTILLFFLGLLIGISSLLTQYTGAILGYNNLTNAQLNLWMVPGAVIAGIGCLIAFKFQCHIKYLVWFGFGVFFLENISIYFIIQAQMDTDTLRIPIFFRGLGTSILYTSIWYYSFKKIGPDQLFSALSIMIVVRNFLSPAVASTILSWLSFQIQSQSQTDMSVYIDLGQNYLPGQSIIQSKESLMSMLKIIAGILCWLTIPIFIFISNYHYGRLSSYNFLSKIYRKRKKYKLFNN
ncbi:MFS transporter [Chishuiella sp.]|uniref:MFS transporter n=1 Tax=Chishuiella sp. TaxID=1969467 RepID=UPI0028A62683|nr:MFS transporter [Chishuiella sp.]